MIATYFLFRHWTDFYVGLISKFLVLRVCVSVITNACDERDETYVLIRIYKGHIALPLTGAAELKFALMQ